MKKERIKGGRDLLYGCVFILAGLFGFIISPRDGIWELVVALSFAIIFGILFVLLLRSVLTAQYAKSMKMKKFVLGKGLYTKIGYGMVLFFFVALIVRTVMEGSVDPSLFYIAIPFCSIFTYISVLYIGDKEIIVNGKIIKSNEISNVVVEKGFLGLYAIRVKTQERKLPYEIQFGRQNTQLIVAYFDKDTMIRVEDIADDLVD